MSTPDEPIPSGARLTVLLSAPEITRTSCSNLSSFVTPITKTSKIYLYVDGIGGASGLAKLQITVTP